MKTTRSKTVLLIDDESAIRRTMAALLKPTGHKIAEAADGSAAIELVRNEHIDLIILDYNMPVMDGLAFLKILRLELQNQTPVLMMSGNPEAELRKQCYALGVFDFIMKPESQDILQARVENGLKIAELMEFRKNTKYEMQIACAILKNTAIPVSIEHPAFTLYTLTQSLHEVGGDLCLMLGSETEHPVFAIADIMGHGVGAALFNIFLTHAFRRAYDENPHPGHIAERLNAEIAGHRGFFVTMFCASFHAPAGTLSYVNAGHPAPLWHSAGKNRSLPETEGAALGISLKQKFTAQEIRMAPGDWLLMFTDGVQDLLQEGEYLKDETLDRIAESGGAAAAVFSEISRHVSAQVDAIDDRSVMLFSMNGS